MASYAGSRCNRTGNKCSGLPLSEPLTRGAGLWFLIVYAMFSAQCVDGQKCMSVDMTVATYPQGDINIQHGEPLDILCVTENYTAEDLKFFVGITPQKSIKINDTAIRLHIVKPEIQSTMYACTNTRTIGVCLNKVIVDTPPKEVTDFECISKNLDSMNCSWTSSQAILKMEYYLSFYMNSARIDCKVQRLGDSWFCFLSLRTKPQYRQLLTEYNFNLTSCNKFGCIQQNITLDHYAVVKPDKPINLTYTITGPHSVLLRWKISMSLVDYLKCGLDHKIEYQIDKIDNPKYFHQVNTTCPPPPEAGGQVNKTYIKKYYDNVNGTCIPPYNHEEYKFELTNLPYAHMRYEVRVYIKSKQATDENWSDYEYQVFRTDSEIPQRPPEMPAGAFYIQPYSNNSNREIYVYWKQLEEYEENGTNFTYTILVNQENKTQELQPDKNKSLSYVVLSATTETLELTVKSTNSKGSSRNSSYLYIPPQSKVLEGSKSFTKLAYANGTYDLSWNIKNFHAIDNYTLFWCRYNWTQVCVGRMNFTTLEATKKTHLIDLPSDQRYQFAISVNSGAQSSGMIWAKCDISKDAANYDIPVRLNHESPIDSSVVITWDMECTLKKNIVVGYNITYCPVVYTSEICDDSVGTKYANISDPMTMSVNITNLLYHRTYKFGFTLVTAQGPISIKYASTRVTTPEGTPSRPINVNITNITDTSAVISYDPPVTKNGNIVVYVIYNYGKVFVNDTNNLPNSTDNSRRHFLIPNLKPFTNYSWTVVACNKHCSKDNSTPIWMRTRIGPPSKLTHLSLNADNPDLLIWYPPENFGGNPDKILYEVKMVQDKQESEHQFTNNTYLPFSGQCNGLINYYVRAINIDEDGNYGARGDPEYVSLPARNESNINKKLKYYGEWSEFFSKDCRGNLTLGMIIMLMILFAFVIGLSFGFLKVYNKYRLMKDIKAILPEGLGVVDPPEISSKYSFPGWPPTRKDDKHSEEKSLLHYSKPILPPSEIKLNKDEHSGTSDRTDSTNVTDASPDIPAEREASTDDGSDCSLDVEPMELQNKAEDQESASTDVPCTPEQSPMFSDLAFKKLTKPGHIQPIVNPATGYVTSTIMAQPTTSSYVMASLDPPIITQSAAPNVPLRPQQTSGYVRQEDLQPKPKIMNFPTLGISPTKPFENGLSTLPNLPPLTKNDAGSFQLQNLDSLPIIKAAARNAAAVKVPNPGYVTADNAVVTKHLNILSGNQQGADDPAILDPDVMSPDAYCRFSWNVNPANDNLNSLRADSPTEHSSRN